MTILCAGEVFLEPLAAMTLRHYWNGLPSYARWFFWISLSTGFALLVAGLVGDRSQFWSERGFLANVTTSLIGALFGIPIALVVIGWFTYNQADRVEAGSVQHLSVNAWEDFYHAVVAYTPPAVTDALLIAVPDVADGYDEITARLRTIVYNESYRSIYGWTPVEVAETAAVRDFVRRRWTPLHNATRDLDAALDSTLQPSGVDQPSWSMAISHY